jgi:hypothetical protein
MPSDTRSSARPATEPKRLAALEARVDRIEQELERQRLLLVKIIEAMGTIRAYFVTTDASGEDRELLAELDARWLALTTHAEAVASWLALPDDAAARVS